MAVPKQPENSRKIIDVSHPDSTASDTSSKPVLITNRPIMKDPMVVDSSENKETDTKVSVKASGEAIIEPITAPILPLENSEDQTTESRQDPEVKEIPAETKVEGLNSNSKSSRDKLGPDETDDAKKDIDEAKTGVENSTDEKVKDDTKKRESKNADMSEEHESNRDTPDEKSAEVIDAEETEKQAKHDAEIDKLIESREYYLPINSVEKRRSKRFVLLGVLLSAVLLLAWADIALDAGLVNISSNIPHTHIFSSSSQSGAPTATSPCVSSTHSTTAVTPANNKLKEQASAIQTLLEAFFTTNNYYPKDLAPNVLINQPGVTGVTEAMLTPPNGAKFIYTTFPSGCTADSKNCLHYTLKVMTTKGKLINSLHSIN
jgi:hypothetical protein